MPCSCVGREETKSTVDVQEFQRVYERFSLTFVDDENRTFGTLNPIADETDKFDFDIKSKKGKDNHFTDAMSRLQTDGET